MSIEAAKSLIESQLEAMESNVHRYDHMKALQKWVNTVCYNLNTEIKAELSPGEMAHCHDGLAGSSYYRVDERWTANFKPQVWELLEKHNRLAGYLVPNSSALKEDLEGGVIEPALAQELKQYEDHIPVLHLIKEVVPHPKN
jgi:hypothetical protein